MLGSLSRASAGETFTTAAPGARGSKDCEETVFARKIRIEQYRENLEHIAQHSLLLDNDQMPLFECR
jgi:hypothetical protein